MFPIMFIIILSPRKQFTDMYFLWRKKVYSNQNHPNNHYQTKKLGSPVPASIVLPAVTCIYVHPLEDPPSNHYLL